MAAPFCRVNLGDASRVPAAPFNIILENAGWYPQQPPHGYVDGYAYEPPPPPRTGNLELVLLLAIGLPVLLLASSSAMFFVLTDRGTVTVRDTLEIGTTENVPTVRFEPGTAPSGTATVPFD